MKRTKIWNVVLLVVGLLMGLAIRDVLKIFEQTEATAQRKEIQLVGLSQMPTEEEVKVLSDSELDKQIERARSAHNEWESRYNTISFQLRYIEQGTLRDDNKEKLLKEKEEAWKNFKALGERRELLDKERRRRLVEEK